MYCNNQLTADNYLSYIHPIGIICFGLEKEIADLENKKENKSKEKRRSDLIKHYWYCTCTNAHVPRFKVFETPLLEGSFGHITILIVQFRVGRAKPTGGSHAVR